MNPLPTNSLDLVILLFKNMPNHQIAGGQLSGTLGAGLDFSALQEALDAADIFISGDSNSRHLECHLPQHFYASLAALLTAPNRRVVALPRFYLADLDYLHEGEETTAPPIVQHYLQAAKLYVLLEKVADHQGGVGAERTLIFWCKNKIEVTSQYGCSDLRELGGLQTFANDFIQSTTHKEQKQTIVKTVLLELFPGRTKVPISELLTRFSDFVDKVQASYQLYVAEFSFQKVKAEVEKEKLDAMVKLNKVFSDIQSQLLAVPVALVLAGGQMEAKGHWSSKNVLIWFASLIFAGLMSLLIRNQRHTLKAVKQEIDQQRQQLESKYQAVDLRFRQAYDEIYGRHRHQQWLIRIVEGLVALSLLITTFLLLWFSGALFVGDEFPFLHFPFLHY